MKSIIFIGGIFGVGKSTLCQILSTQLDVQYLRASTLIFEYRKQQPVKSKRITDEENMNNNQSALISALQQIKSSQPILLEGHACLLDEKDQVMHIPAETFLNIHASGMILVTRSVNAVLHNLLQRDGKQYTKDSLIELQAAESSYMLDLSEKLSTPLLIVDLDADSLAIAAQKVKRFISKYS